VYIGARRQKAFLIGETSFAHQTVDAVTATAGSAPGPGAVLSDVQNAGSGNGVGGAGGSVRLFAGNGRVVSLPVSGQGRNLTGGQMVAQDGVVALYATTQTVAALSGTPGYTQLRYRLRDPSLSAAHRTVTAIRQYLQTVPGFTGFSDLPQIRAPGDWPGKSRFNDLTSILYVVTLLALVGALVLLSSTMTTVIGEQTPEIATMKAIGAGRKQIRNVYLRTATLLGALGALTGAVLGILLSWALTAYFASSLFAISAPFSVDLPVLIASVALGVIGPPLAALPAIRRAARLPLAETLQASGARPGPRTLLTGCCAARASFPAPRKSGYAASPAAAGAASRPLFRSGSPSGRCSRSCRSPPALATPSTSPGAPTATTSTQGRCWVRRFRQASAR
jgi:putative ABC transport system permease protein